jgi:hypothetical protein
LAGLIIGALLVSVVPAVAANGDLAILGNRNTSQNPTKFVSRNATQLENIKAGRPALRLTVKSGAPPMAVNSSVKVDNLNADLLDGYHFYQLQAKAEACGADYIPEAFGVTSWSCDVDITIPVGGLLLMSGSIEASNGSNTTIDTVTCELAINDEPIFHSNRDVDISFDPDGDQAVCATNAWKSVGAGTYNFEFAIDGVAAATDLNAAAAHVIFIPGS